MYWPQGPPLHLISAPAPTRSRPSPGGFTKYLPLKAPNPWALYGNYITMRLEQIIDQRMYLIQGQFSRGMRVEHGCTIDMLFLARQYRLDHQALYIDIGHL